MPRITRLFLLLALVVSLAGCAAPSPTPPASGNLAGSAPPAPPEPASAPPPMSSPLPPRPVKESVIVDSTCKTSADCAVKNVGNCCGAMPACVNKDSPTDPAAVQAECNARGEMSICGFKEISACQCDDGQCAPAEGSGAQAQ